MDSLLYFITFIVFVYIAFTILKATNFEKLFKQGKIFEIKVAYTFVSFILAYLITELIFKLYSLFNV